MPLSNGSRYWGKEINALAVLRPTQFAEYQTLVKQMEVEEERELCQDSLLEFLKHCWPHMGESAELSINWHHVAMIESLEAIARGELRNLVINIPPRHTKSLVVNVAYPAWLWAQEKDPEYPLMGPHVRFLSVSFAAHLAERFGLKMLNLVQSEWYQKLWGRQVRIRTDQQSRAAFANTKGGERMSASVEAGLLGRGADVILCFPSDEVCLTEHGYISIGDIVKHRMQVRVWSVNLDTGCVELKPLEAWFENPGSEIVEIDLDDGSTLRCTPNHRIWVNDSDWRCAAKLVTGDTLSQMRPGISLSNVRDRSLIDPILACQSPYAAWLGKNIYYLLFRKFRSAVVRASMTSIGLSNVFKMTPAFAGADLFYRAGFDAKSLGQIIGSFSAGENFNHLFFCKFRKARSFAIKYSPMRASVLKILSTGAVTKIVKTRVLRVSVTMAYFLSRWTRTEKCTSNYDVDVSIPAFPVFTKNSSWISVAVKSAREKSAAPLVKIAVPEYQSVQASYAAESTGLVKSFITRNGFPHLQARRVVNVRSVGHVDKTYCVAVAGNHSMFMGLGTILCSNCDDPHDVEGAESAIQRDATVRAFSESLSTRVTDPRIAARVLIMQRLHESDCTNWALDHWPHAVTRHLMFPARFDPNFACEEDPRQSAGQPLWPELWGDQALAEIEVQVGPYSFAGQYQQVPSPREGGVIEIRDWQVFPEEPPDPSSVRRTADGQIMLELPEVSYVVLSIDTAMSEDETSAWNACVVWGVWHRRRNQVSNIVGMERPWFSGRWSSAPLSENDIRQQIIEDDDQPRAIMMEAWRRRCKLNDASLDRLGRPQGLVQRIIETARRRHADKIIIEDKTRAKDVRDEIIRQMGSEAFQIEMFNPQRHGDKLARLYAVQPLFSQKLIYAPGNYEIVTGPDGHQRCEVREELKWVQAVIHEIAQVPRGKFDDLADSASMGLIWLRENGFLELTRQHMERAMREKLWQPKSTSIGAAYGV